MAKRSSVRSTVQGRLDVYNAACVVRFLNAVQLLSGCDYTNDARIERGDALIRRFAADDLLGLKPARLSIKEAADVLHFLGNVEPLEGEAVFDGGREHVGLTWILTWVDRSLTGRHPRGAA